MQTWKQGKVRLQTEEGPTEIAATVKGGLAIHRNLEWIWDGDALKRKAVGKHLSTWGVTHTESGLSFGVKLRQKKGAREAAERFLELGDWTGDISGQMPKSGKASKMIAAAGDLVLAIRRNTESRRRC